jgi:glycosyltransferase involved in cell wall biosynthesis
LVESKGVHHLINALHQLKKIRRDWVCWIVGDGPKRNEFQNLVKKLGLQNHLIFLGKRDDIPYLLSISDLFILPTLMDNQPLSIIEAQIAGKAIIASNVGGIPEMIQDRLTGLLFPPGDVASLVNHINYLFNHENVRLNLGQRAQKWALKHWSIQRATQKVLNVYQTAIKKRNKS